MVLFSTASTASLANWGSVGSLIYCCLSGKLWYLQHNCVGDTIVYHSDCDMRLWYHIMYNCTTNIWHHAIYTINWNSWTWKILQTMYTGAYICNIADDLLIINLYDCFHKMFLTNYKIWSWITSVNKNILHPWKYRIRTQTFMSY